MKPSPRQPAKVQQRLPLTRDARFGSLLRIDPARLGIGRRQWSRVVDLLRQVELCGQRDGCYAYAETLAARMDEGLGVSVDTLHRARRAATAAGLLTVKRRHNGRHQQSNQWSVDWSRVALLASPEEAPQRTLPDQPSSCANQPSSSPIHEREAASPTATPGYQTATPGYQTARLLRGTTSSSTCSSVSGRQSTEEKRSNEPTPAPRVLHHADERVALKFLKAIGGRYSPRDAALAWKLVALAPQFGDAWLWGIAEAVRTIAPQNRWAYVWRCAANGAHETPGPGEQRLRRSLVRCSEPPPGWPVRAAGPDFSERLCAATSDDD